MDPMNLNLGHKMIDQILLKSSQKRDESHGPEFEEIEIRQMSLNSDQEDDRLNESEFESKRN
jgi:hypothetical protein